MSPKKLVRMLTKAVQNEIQILIKGAPGIGKTDIVLLVAKITKMDVILMHPVVSDPTDFKGLPAIVNGKACFLPYGQLRKLVETNKKTICFIDDAGQAPATVQAALMQLVFGKTVNEHDISNKIVFLAATNRREDRAHVTAILEPLKSRFHSIVELIIDKGEWIEWALQNDIVAEVIAFINMNPDMLLTGKATSEIINHPSPRMWKHVSDMIKAEILDLETAIGAVGEIAGAAFVGFLKVWTTLPDLDDLIANPKRAAVPTEPSALYAIVSALCKRIDKKNAENIFEYGKRLPNEFDTLLGLDAERKNPKIKETKGYCDWIIRHPEISSGMAA